MRRFAFLYITMALFSAGAFAASPQGPQTVTLDGRLFSDTALTNPLLDPSVLFDIQILDPSKKCVLYEEQQTIPTNASNGYFNLQVGSFSPDAKRAGSDPANAMVAVFQNAVAIPATNAGCPGYTPVAGDVRYIQVMVKPSTTGVFDTLSPDMTIDSVPNAMVAESLQGLNRSQVLEIGTVPDLTQLNVETVFSTTNYPALTALLAGTSSQYVQSSATGGAQIPVVAGTPASPGTGDVWFNSTGAGALQYFDGTSVQSVGIGGGSVTSVTAGTGLTGGTITSTGTINLSDVGTAGTYTKVTTDAQGRVTAGAQITGNDITSGTIGGSTAINTTGNITTTTGNVSAQNVSANGASFRTLVLNDTTLPIPNTLTLEAPATITSNYTLKFPAAAPLSNGQVLSSDTSGTFSWVTPSVGTITGVTAGTGLSGGGTSGTVTVNLASTSVTAGSYGSATQVPTFTVNADGQLTAAANVTISGVAPAGAAGGDLSGTYPNPVVAQIQQIPVSATAPTAPGQVLKYDGTTQYAPGFIGVADVRSTQAGNAAFFPLNCTSSQTLTYSAITDVMSCASIAVSDTAITYGSETKNTFLAAPNGSNGAPTYRSIAAADLPAGGYDSTYFKNGGNAFGSAATLGTTDTNTLNIVTNGTGITLDTAGHVGIGTTTPTAALQLKAGTATAGTAPLKLTSGIVLGTPEPGAIEYDGTSLFYTDNTNARHALAAAGSGLTALTGDVSASGSGSVAATVNAVNGVAYPAAPATNTVPVVTGAGTVTYETIPNASLANDSLTIGSTSIALGTTATTISGLATLNLGTSGTTAGLLTVANGTGGGASVSIENPSTTTAYNFNLPATAGAAGQVLTSQGGVGAAMTWTTPTTGTVTGMSVNTSNGFAGTSSGGATPALTISTSVTGMLKGNGTAMSAATSGTDYSAGTSALTTGILKSTTATGALTIAVPADFPTLNQNTTGTAAGLSSTLAVASGGTGQTSFTNGQLLIGDTTGNTLAPATLTAGSGVSITNGAGSITIATTGAAPTGAASGDLGGTYPSPTVVSVADVTTGILAVANGGTGTNNGSITGTGALAFTASGASNNVTVTPGAGGYTLLSGGNVGIGATTPTAALQLKAGTATAGTAPLKLTAGVNLGTPESGAIEYDGTSLFYTDSTNARHALAAAGSGLTALTGDVTATGSGSVAATVNAVNGVAYPAVPATNTVPVVTGAGTVTYETIPNAALTNNSLTIGSTSIALGTTATSISGLATLNLGTSGTTAGLLTVANGTGGGAAVSIENPSTTTAYNFNLPATAGAAGQVLTSQGGVGAAMTWTTPTTGTMTGVSVNTSNGFAGTSSGGATPALTISTSVTGVLKGNGTAMSAATSGTDYSAGTSALTTGILKSTTATGALTIAVPADFPTLNQNTTGTAAGLSSTLAVASGGTGQTSFTNGQLLIGDTTGNTLVPATLTAGSGVSITNGTGSITIATTGAPPTGAASGDLGGTYPSPTVLSVADVTTGILAVANGGTGTATGSITGTGSLTFAAAAGNNNVILTSTGTGGVGIGTTTPTAALQLKAGTATAGTAPLKLTAGTVLGTPESGAIEYDGTSLFYTDSTNARHTLAAAGAGLTALTGDVSASGSGSVAATVNKVNGVAYSSGPSTNTVPVVTSANTVTYETIPNAALTNNSLTIGSTSIALGATATTISGLATLNLGTSGTTAGLLTVANGTGGGASVSIENPSTTTAYNFNLPATAGTAGQVLTSQGGVGSAMTWTTLTTGTVTSVGLNDASTTPIYSITNSPVTGSGTLTFTLASQVKNTILAGPTTGGNAQPGFRGLVAADLPMPTVAAVGGVEAINAVAHEWISSIDTSGVPHLTQPAVADLSNAANVVLNNQANTYTAGPQSLGSQVLSTQITNATTTGTTANKLAVLTGAPATAVVATTAQTTGVVGIVVAGAGTAGVADIATSGQASCVFDGATTAGHYVIASVTTGGDCHDGGATMPGSGQVLGRVLSTNGGGGTYAMLLFSNEIDGVSTGGATSVASGGTGDTTLTAHGVMIGEGVGNVVVTSAGTTGYLLTGAGGAADPTFSQINLGTSPAITGTLGVTSGGTGLASTTVNQLLYSSAGNTIAGLATANGGILNTSNAGVPSITATPTLGVNGAAGTTGQLLLANGVASGTSIAIQNGGATTAYNFNLPTTVGTAGQVLTSQAGGATAMTWTTLAPSASTQLTSGQIWLGSAGNVSTAVIPSGDATMTNAGVTTVAKVNGVSYGSGPSTNTIPVVTSANTVTYEAVPLAAVASIADATLLSNISGAGAAPSANTLSSIIDHDIGSTQGDILYRDTNGNGWKVLAPGSAGQILQTGGAAANPSWTNAGGSGTVTSVGLNDASTTPIYTITNSPVTGSGTLTFTLASQVKNTILAGPTTGGNAQPGFRGLVAADLPMPTVAAVGGVEAINAVAHEWISSIDTSGVPHLTQPAVADLSNAANVVLNNQANTYTAGPQSLGSQVLSTQITNAGATGTTVNKLAVLTGAPATAVVATTAQTTGVVGIVVAGAGTAGVADIATSGQASCVFDGATTAGHYVIASVTTGGDCHDGGATMPSAGQVLGRVLSTNGAGGTYAMLLFSNEIDGVSTGGATSVATGGTGDTTLTAHGVMIGEGVGNVAVTSAGTTGYLLTGAGGAADPTFSQLNLGTSAAITGTLGAANGGTGVASPTAHGVLLAEGAGAAVSQTSGAAGQIMQGNGSSADPTFTAAPTLGAVGTTGTLSFAGTTSGVVTVQPQSAAGTYNFNLPITVGTAGQVLTSQAGGATAMTWTTLAPSASTQLTSGQIWLGSAGNVSTAVIPSGDATMTNAGVTTVAKVNGVSYGSGPSTNTIPVVTSANTVTYEAVPLAAVASIADATLLSNISGAGAAPSANTLSSIIDHDIGSTQGDILYRDTNGNGWKVLAPGSAGQILQTGGAAANPSWTNAGGSGTVTSVGLNDASTTPIYTITNSPITGSGTLTFTLASQVKNTILAGPTTGGNAQPGFRGLVAADLPMPTVAAVGGVEAINAVAHEWISSIDTSGVPHLTQPAVADLSNAANVVLNNQANTYTAGPQSLGSQVLSTQITNATTTGTTANKLAVLTGAPATAVKATTAQTTGVVGIVVAGAGTAGVADIATSGQASCVFDGATTAGDYVIVSTTTAGDCHDSGAAMPGSGQVLGRVLSTNGAGGTYAMLLFSNEIDGVSTGGATSVATGGTGDTTLTAHGVMIGEGVGNVAVTSAGTTGYLLTGAGGAADPTFSQLNLGTSAAITGILAAVNGGTGVASPTAHGVLLAEGAGAAVSSVGAAGTIHQGNGAASDPTWTAGPTLGAVGTTGTLSFAGTTSGVVTVQPQSAAGTYNFNLPTTVGAAGQVLTSQAGGATAMTWTTLAPSASTQLTSGQIWVGNSSNVSAAVTPAGDATISNTGATTVAKVNGVSYGSGPATNTVPIVTSANTVTYEAVPIAAGGTGLTSSTASSVLLTNGSNVPSWNAIANDNFTQYALLAGRAGGQTLDGGTAAADSLTLNSTSHASPTGYVLLQPGGGNVGIGSTTPGAALDVGTGGIFIGNGTAAAPSLAFGSNSNTGIFRNGANQLGFSAAGGLVAVVTSTGILMNTGDAPYIHPGAAGGCNAPNYSFATSTGTGLADIAGNNLSLCGGGNEGMRIDSSGNVVVGAGDGANNPGNGILRAPNVFTGQTNHTGSNLTIQAGLATGNAATGNISFNGAPPGSTGTTQETATTYMTIVGGGASAGDVGIGTTTPQAPMHILGAGAAFKGQLTLTDPTATGSSTSSAVTISAYGSDGASGSSTGRKWFFGNRGNSTNDIALANSQNGMIDFLDSAFDVRMAIDTSTGNVGIGTATPASALDTNGAVTVEGMAAPAVSPAGDGRIYFDSTSHLFMVSQNGGAYANLATGTLPMAGGTMTGQLVGEDGTAGAPSFALNGDTGTGFYQDSSHVIGVSNNGTESMKLSATGITGTGAMTVAATGANNLTLSGGSSGYVVLTPNVGIGSTTPTAPLDVLQNTNVGGTTPTGIGIHTTNSNSSSFASLAAYNNGGAWASVNSYGSGAFGEYANSGGLASSNSLMLITDAGVGSGGTDPILFLVGGYGTSMEKMRIASSGNVGIGTTSADTPLYINQSSDTVPLTSTTYGLSVGDQGSRRVSIGGDANYGYIQSFNNKPLQINSQLNNTLLNSNGGLVGIGTTDPTANLHVVGTWPNNTAQFDMNVEGVGSGNSNAVVLNNTYGAGNFKNELDFAGSGTLYWSIENDVLGDGGQTFAITDETNGYRRLWIDSFGDFGLNNVYPQTSLDVGGAVATGSIETASQFQLTRPVNGGVSYPQVVDFNIGSYAVNGGGNGYAPSTRLDISLKAAANSTLAGDTNVMTLESNGNVGIGTTAPAATLDINGNAKFRGGINATVLVYTSTGAITVTTSNYIICVNKASGAATTVNLPASPNSGDQYVIKDCKGDAATNNITVTPNAGTIDGAASYVMSTAYQSAGVFYDGTQWHVF